LIVFGHFLAAVDERAIIEFVHLLVELDFLIKLPVRLLQLVVLLVQLVDIVE